MKLNKTIRIAIGSILGTFLVLFVILVAHIATAKPIVYDNANLQISRIDFKQPIDSLTAKQIHRQMKTIPGVKNDKLNPETGVMVYFHDNRVTNSKKVFTALMAQGNYKAEPFTVPAALAGKQVCPVMNKDGFTYKFSRGIQRIFH